MNFDSITIDSHRLIPIKCICSADYVLVQDSIWDPVDVVVINSLSHHIYDAIWDIT